MKIREYPSPNFGERKGLARIEYVILHFTGMDDVDEVCELLCDEERELSAHYVLDKSGNVVRMVEEKMRAWHAGNSYWRGENDLNSSSIGIEIVNNGAMPFFDVQYEVLIELLRDICQRWDIPPQNVLGHSDIAIGRKFDPGPWFDWLRLEAAGVSVPPKADFDQEYAARGEAAFLKLAASAGYNPEAEFQALLTAVRVRHGATPYYGPLRESDFTILMR